MKLAHNVWKVWPTSRPRLQFGLRTFLLSIAVISVVLALVASPASRQHSAVRNLERLNCTVVYDHECRDAQGKQSAWYCFEFGPKCQWRSQSLTPATWREAPWAIDYFHSATSVRLDERQVEAAIPYLQQMPRLTEILMLDPVGSCGTGAEERWKRAQVKLEPLRRALPHVKITFYHLAVIG